MIVFLLSFFIINGLISLILYKFQKFVNYFSGIVTALISFLSLFFVILHYFLKSFSFSNNYIGIDNLSSFFLFLLFLGSIFSSIYAINYLSHYYNKKNLAVHWFLINIFISSICLVLISKNIVLFIVAWEIMSFSSFFLVLFEGEKKEVSKAAFIYIVATHIGTMFLFAMFLLFSREYYTFDMSKWGEIKDSFLASIIFIFALIGFGTKAGLMPMHIWLPEAHPAAPSHVSAMMSGIMIKVGMYGIIRILMLLKIVQIWWGYLLIIIGLITAFLGILFAISQHDIKKSLAYSSIENIGLITIGIGAGIIGISINNTLIAILGFSASLFHILNHFLFKSLLFMGAGSIYFATGTRNIDLLGGLLKKMPITGITFLIGGIAISGLPPFNGFISEFLLYFVFFKNILFNNTILIIVSSFAIIFIAMIGAIAVAKFTKLFGIIFLGEPRNSKYQDAKEVPFLMLISMLFFSICNITIGLTSPFVFKVISNILPKDMLIVTSEIEYNLSKISNILVLITIVALILYAVMIILFIKRKILLINKKIEYSPTWDCGYAKPNSRMQYSGSSFVQPITDFFKDILKSERTIIKVTENFPSTSKFKTKTKDIFTTIFNPLIEIIRKINKRLTIFQHGYMQLYILYIFITLIILLIWKL